MSGYERENRNVLKRCMKTVTVMATGWIRRAKYFGAVTEAVVYQSAHTTWAEPAAEHAANAGQSEEVRLMNW